MADDQKPIGPAVLDTVDAAAAVRALRRRRPGEELDLQPLDGVRHIAVDVPYQHGWFHLKMRDADGNTETWALSPRDGILVAGLILQATHTVMQDTSLNVERADSVDLPCKECGRPERHHAPGAVCAIFIPSKEPAMGETREDGASYCTVHHRWESPEEWMACDDELYRGAAAAVKDRIKGGAS